MCRPIDVVFETDLVLKEDRRIFELLEESELGNNEALIEKMGKLLAQAALTAREEDDEDSCLGGIENSGRSDVDSVGADRDGRRGSGRDESGSQETKSSYE